MPHNFLKMSFWVSVTPPVVIMYHVCLSVCLTVPLSGCLSDCSLSGFLSDCPAVRLSVCLLPSISMSMSPPLSLPLPTSPLFLHQFLICLPLSVSLLSPFSPHFLSVCVSIFISPSLPSFIFFSILCPSLSLPLPPSLSPSLLVISCLLWINIQFESCVYAYSLPKSDISHHNGIMS